MNYQKHKKRRSYEERTGRMEQQAHRSEVMLSESFMYDGIIIALIISVANNLYDLGVLDLANDVYFDTHNDGMALLNISSGTLMSSTLISGIDLLFYTTLLGGAALNTIVYKTYGISYIPIIIAPMIITLLVDYEFGASAGLILSLSTAFHHHDFFMFLHLFPQVVISTYLLKTQRIEYRSQKLV